MEALNYLLILCISLVGGITGGIVILGIYKGIRYITCAIKKVREEEINFNSPKCISNFFIANDVNEKLVTEVVAIATEIGVKYGFIWFNRVIDQFAINNNIDISKLKLYIDIEFQKAVKKYEESIINNH